MLAGVALDEQLAPQKPRARSATAPLSASAPAARSNRDLSMPLEIFVVLGIFSFHQYRENPSLIWLKYSADISNAGIRKFGRENVQVSVVQSDRGTVRLSTCRFVSYHSLATGWSCDCKDLVARSGFGFAKTASKMERIQSSWIDRCPFTDRRWWQYKLSFIGNYYRGLN